MALEEDSEMAKVTNWHIDDICIPSILVVHRSNSREPARAMGGGRAMSEQITVGELLVENGKLRRRLEEAEETLRAIGDGEMARRHGEASLLRMNRLYSVLSQTNQAIVRATERESLFGEICRIAVEQGGLLLAWIGLVDEDSGLVRADGLDGKNEGYLDNIRISVFEEPEGMGPSGRAIRARPMCASPAIS